VKIKIGIFFGGSSREREISFAGGRTVYDNLDKTLFEAVPVFVDSFHNFILLDWQYIYKGTIRDFFPPIEHTPDSKHPFQVYEESLGDLPIDEQDKLIASVGKKILPVDFKSYFNFAFLTLHGAFGEDGTIQGLFEFYGMPYSGSGILPSAIGINKAFQKRMMSSGGFISTQFITIKRNEWTNQAVDSILKSVTDKVGFPIVVKPANQGSSVGVSIVHAEDKTKTH
jgi:D-alanine-D-alanine ligase